jgi:hypothetical protein
VLRRRRARIGCSWSYVARVRLFPVPVDLPKYKVVSVHTGSAREHVDSTPCRPGLRFLFCFCFSTAVVFVLVFRFLLLSGLVLFFYDAVSVCFFSVVLGAPVSVFLRPTGLTCFVLGDSLGLGARQRLGGGAAGQRARSARPASAPARGGAAARMSALNRQSQ